MKRNNDVHVLLALVSVIFIGCTREQLPEKSSGNHIYTLYRGGVIDKSFRLHFATFETLGERSDWNKENCEKVVDYLNGTQNHQMNPVKFWCEKGRYKK